MAFFGWLGFLSATEYEVVWEIKQSYFGKQNWFGPHVGLKACEIKELRTDWFLKLDRRALGYSKRPTASVGGVSVAVVHGKAIGLPAQQWPQLTAREEGLGREKEPLQDCKALWWNRTTTSFTEQSRPCSRPIKGESLQGMVAFLSTKWERHWGQCSRPGKMCSSSSSSQGVLVNLVLVAGPLRSS